MGTKITIELPDWAEERHIYIMAGIEMLAYKLYGEDVVHVKTERCCACGECCMDLSLASILPVGPDGHCAYLEAPVGTARNCNLGVYRPIGCSVGLHKRGAFGHKSCTVEYKAQ